MAGPECLSSVAWLVAWTETVTGQQTWQYLPSPPPPPPLPQPSAWHFWIIETALLNFRVARTIQKFIQWWRFFGKISELFVAVAVAGISRTYLIRHLDTFTLIKIHGNWRKCSSACSAAVLSSAEVSCFLFSVGDWLLIASFSLADEAWIFMLVWPIGQTVGTSFSEIETADKLFQHFQFIFKLHSYKATNFNLDLKRFVKSNHLYNLTETRRSCTVYGCIYSQSTI